MGAFFLIHRSVGAAFDELRDRLAAGFERQGFRRAAGLKGRCWEAVGYAPLCGGAVQVEDAGASAFCAGTLLYAGLAREQALRRLLDDHCKGEVDEAALSGSFAAVLAVGERATVISDRTGTLHIHAANGQGVLSTSFLALAEALPALSIDADGLYDYVLQGAPMGPGTVFNEISLLDSERILVFDGDIRQEARPPRSAARLRPAGLDGWAEHFVALLRDRFAAASGAWRDVDTALSGGYDSRLLLALAWDAGLRPHVHVYGRDSDADVACAKAIAAAEGFPLDHVDKSAVPLPPPEHFAEIVEANYLTFDGYPTDGIFDNGTDKATRLARMAGGRLMLNGGGGEIFRNFFYLPDRPISALGLVWTFYCQFDPGMMTRRFDERAYLGRLAERLRKAVGAGPDPLTRRQVEAAYPWFRCRYWTGHNNSLNNRLGFSWTPFIDATLAEASLEVPLRFKNAGRLEARMIAHLAPRLAAHGSAYGHGFDRPPPLAYRLQDLANRWRPPLLRRHSYRWKHRQPAGFEGALAPPLLSAVIDREFPYLREYLRLERIGDSAQLQRICTLEYMFQRLQPRHG